MSVRGKKRKKREWGVGEEMGGGEGNVYEGKETEELGCRDEWM